MKLTSVGGVLVLLLLSAYAQEHTSFGVGVEVGGVSVEVDLCEGVECEEGDECHVVASPLLQLPVAHCVHSEGATPHMKQDPCREITVGTNVLSCRSEKEWQEVGVRQCLLRTSQGVGLTGVKVQHACHSRRPGRTIRFLSAMFTCCPQEQLAATTSPPTTGSSPPSTQHTLTSAPSPPPASDPATTSEQQPSGHLLAGDDGEGTEDRHDHISILIPVALGAVVVMAVVALACRLRYKGRSPKVPTPTFFVNESSDGFGVGVEGEGWEGGGWGSGDTSLILPNKHSSCGK